MATPERRMELLKLARRSQRLFVLDECDEESLNFIKEQISKETKGFDFARHPIPGVKGLQTVLDYLNEVVGDEMNMMVESLLPIADALDDTLDHELNDTNTTSSSSSSSSNSNSKDEEHKDNINTSSSSSNKQMNYDDNISTYTIFLDRLRRSEANDMVVDIQRFTSSLCSKMRHERAAAGGNLTINMHKEGCNKVWTLINSYSTFMKDSPIWNVSSNNNNHDFNLSIERFLYSKLYTEIFAADIDDHLADRKLYNKLLQLKELEPNHLDIESAMWGGRDWKQVLSLSIQEINNLETYKSPSDMHICIRKATEAIGTVLRETAKAVSEGKLTLNKSAFGADDFLPHMILVIKEVCPSQMKSVLFFLERYTPTSQLDGQQGYLLAQMNSAVHFLETYEIEDIHSMNSLSSSSSSSVDGIGNSNSNMDTSSSSSNISNSIQASLKSAAEKSEIRLQDTIDAANQMEIKIEKTKQNQITETCASPLRVKSSSSSSSSSSRPTLLQFSRSRNGLSTR